MKGTEVSPILWVCDDDHLSMVLALLLEIAGFEVESCDSANAQIECQVRSFQIAILCHSILDTSKLTLTKELSGSVPTSKSSVSLAQRSRSFMDVRYDVATACTP